MTDSTAIDAAVGQPSRAAGDAAPAATAARETMLEAAQGRRQERDARAAARPTIRKGPHDQPQ